MSTKMMASKTSETRAKARRLFNSICRQGLLEDRREYDRHDLRMAYDIDQDIADALCMMIQDAFRA